MSEDRRIKCIVCGYMNERGANFCLKCRHPLLQPDDSHWDYDTPVERPPSGVDEEEGAS